MDNSVKIEDDDDLSRCRRVRQELDNGFKSLDEAFAHLKDLERGRKLGSPLWKKSKDTAVRRKASKVQPVSQRPRVTM